MPGHENWTIVSFPDHYYHLLLPKAVTDSDSAYYKGKHGAEITGLESLRSVWNYPIRPAVAPRWDAFKWRSSLTAPSRDLFFNIVDRTDNSVHRVRRRYRYYVKSWGTESTIRYWQLFTVEDVASAKSKNQVQWLPQRVVIIEKSIFTILPFCRKFLFM